MCSDHLLVKAKDAPKYWVMFTAKRNEAQCTDSAKAEKP